MESNTAITLLASLAHPGRLAVFRLLVRAGADGMPAGKIARRLGIAANTLSAQLAILSQAGAITGRRAGRSIRYAVVYDRVGELLVYLMEDCCRGAPEVRATVMAAAMSCCPEPEGESP